jgi:DNA repair exonuclease SbcCD ATPase subunit
MRLLKIELHDVGHFGRYSADLSGNVIGIVGLNGSGKSTVLSSIQYAVTGDLSRLGDKEAVFVNRQPSAKERPFSRLTFDPLGDGEEAVITRNPPVDGKAATRRLLYKGKSYTSKSDVDEWFVKWTGLQPRALSDFVFVAQGTLTDVVTDQTGKRAEVLQKLFGVSEAETARVVLLEHLAKLPQPTDPELLATLRHQAAEAESLLREAETEMRAVGEADYEQEEADRITLAAAKRGRELSIAAESARIRVREAQAVLAVAKPQKPDPDLMRRANDTIEAWNQYKSDRERYDALVKQHAQAVQAYEWISSGERITAGPYPELPAELSHLREAKFAAEAVSKIDTGTCPVCGSTPEPGKLDKQAALNLLDDLAVKEAEYDVRVRQWRAQHELDEMWRKQTEDAAEKAYELLRKLEAVPEPRQPDVDRATAKALLDLSAKAAAVCAADVSRRATAEATIRTASAVIEAAEAHDIPTDAVVAAAENRLSAAAEARTTRAAVSAKLSGARRAYETAKLAIDKAEASGSDHVKTAGWRAVVEGAVKILHKDAAPAATIRACLADLSDDLNRRLGHLGAAFRVAVNQDGGLSAEFPDKVVSSRLLSGGQKVVLSLAWRLAVLDRYAPKAGLLCLDEPTNHLDDARVGALKDAIDAWKPHSKDRQFVIVTHARKLAAACDKVVQLG